MRMTYIGLKFNLLASLAALHCVYFHAWSLKLKISCISFTALQFRKLSKHLMCSRKLYAATRVMEQDTSYRLRGFENAKGYGLGGSIKRETIS